MSGDHQPAIARKPKRKFTPPLIALLVLVFFGLFFVWLTTPQKGLVWLSQAELTPAQKEQPKLFTLVKSAFESFKSFFPRHHSKEIQFHIAELGPVSPKQLGLGAPYSMNTTGIQAWFLNRRQLVDFMQRVKAIPRGTNMGTVTLMMDHSLLDDFPIINSVPAKPGEKAFAGLELHLDATVSGNSVNMVMGITSIEFSTNIPPFEQTSLFFGCKASIPFGDGLVFDDPDGRWLIVCPRPEKSSRQAGNH
jgi:hypothetical protein